MNQLHDIARIADEVEDGKDKTIKRLFATIPVVLVLSFASNIYLASRPASVHVVEKGYLVNDETHVIQRFTDLEEVKLSEPEAMAWKDLQFYIQYRNTYSEVLARDTELAMLYSSKEVAADLDAEVRKLYETFGDGMRASVDIRSLILNDAETATAQYTKKVKIRSGEYKETNFTAIIKFKYFAIPEDENKTDHQDFNPFGFQVVYWRATADRMQEGVL